VKPSLPPEFPEFVNLNPWFVTLTYSFRFASGNGIANTLEFCRTKEDR